MAKKLKRKTRSAAAKRFKVSAKGKLIRTRANSNHFRRNKTSKQKQQLRGTLASTNQHAKNILKYSLLT